MCLAATAARIAKAAPGVNLANVEVYVLLKSLCDSECFAAVCRWNHQTLRFRANGFLVAARHTWTLPVAHAHQQMLAISDRGPGANTLLLTR
jgi:hypothetical protein